MARGSASGKRFVPSVAFAFTTRYVSASAGASNVHFACDLYWGDTVCPYKPELEIFSRLFSATATNEIAVREEESTAPGDGCVAKE